jgi:tetratricopeptide (TPR) repeat protein
MKRFSFGVIFSLLFAVAITAQPNQKKPNLFQQGMQHYNKQEYDAAIASFRKFVNTNPPEPKGPNAASTAPALKQKKAEAYYFIGMSFRKKNELEPALQNLNRANELRPDYTQALMQRAEIYVEQKRLDLAVADLTHILQLAPANVEASYLLGSAYVQLQNYDAAIQELNKVLAANPQHAYAHYYIGMAYNQIKKPGNSQEHFKMFLSLCPTCPEAPMVRSYLSRS